MNRRRLEIIVILHLDIAGTNLTSILSIKASLHGLWLLIWNSRTLRLENLEECPKIECNLW